MTMGHHLRSLATPIAIIALFATSVISSSGASAQDASGERACAADMGKGGPCASVKAGGGRIRECLRDHLADLSKPCQEALLKAAIVKKACAADFKEECAGTKPGAGRIKDCMKSNVSDLSGPCKATLARAAAGEN
jgi:hypothetical protein